MPIWRLLTWRGVIRTVAMMQTTKPVVIFTNLYIHDPSQLLSKRKQDISPPTTKVATPYVILSTVSCQAVKNFPSPCGILSSDDERRAGLGYSKFGGVCVRFYKHLSSEFPWAEEGSTGAINTFQLHKASRHFKEARSLYEQYRIRSQAAEVVRTDLQVIHQWSSSAHGIEL